MDKKEKCEIEKIADNKRREFIKKFGSFAATAPLAGYILLTPSSSAAAVTSSTSDENDVPFDIPFGFDF